MIFHCEFWCIRLTELFGAYLGFEMETKTATSSTNVETGNSEYAAGSCSRVASMLGEEHQAATVTARKWL